MANQLTRFDPFGEIARLDPFRGFEDFFRDFRLSPALRAFEANERMRVDIEENEQAYLVRAEIPGVRKEDIKVSIDGNQVTLAAEVRRIEPPPPDAGAHLRQGTQAGIQQGAAQQGTPQQGTQQQGTQQQGQPGPQGNAQPAAGASGRQQGAAQAPAMTQGRPPQAPQMQRQPGPTLMRGERFYGQLYRSFSLPQEIDEGHAEARYLDGILELILPKRPGSGGRQLTIQ